MRIKNFKLFENKEEILDVIGVDESEIKDACQDLIDEFDFTFKITPQWISKSGNIYYKPNQSLEAYPSLLISLERQLTNLESGESIVKKDPRNWNGGVYYEDDANLIKVVYETIKRLESMLDRGEIKVFYSMRSINNIQLRVTIPIEKTKLPIDVENVVNFIENRIERLDDLPYPEYKIEATWTHGNKRSFEIVPKITKFHTDVRYFDEREPGDMILKRLLIEDETNNNIQDLQDIANHVVEKLRDACTKGDAKRSDIVSEYYDGDTYQEIYIKCGDMKLIKISLGIEKVGKGRIKTASGIFKDKFVDVQVNKLEMEINILVGD
jgi:hypothetical protein